MGRLILASRTTRPRKAEPRKNAHVRRKVRRAGAAKSTKPIKRILSIDIGGSGLKAAIVAPDGTMLSKRRRIDTPYPCPPSVMIGSLLKLTAPFAQFDRIAAGFPGVVRDDRVLTAPHFGTEDWKGFPLGHVLCEQLGGVPAKVINDAEMQGLAVIDGTGLELVLTLGTGAGTALFREGELMPHLELAHHPVHKKKTYNDYVGEAARKKIGNKHWNRRVGKVIGILDGLVTYDRLFIGGGNARHIDLDLPANVSPVSNKAGLEGGGPLWCRPLRQRTPA